MCVIMDIFVILKITLSYSITFHPLWVCLIVSIMSGDFLPENSIVVRTLFDSISPFSSLKLKNGSFIVFVQVGCGAVGLDFLATVAAYPKPDQKIRSTSFKVFPFLFNLYSFMLFSSLHHKHSQQLLFSVFFRFLG